jgi:hypothetical protein
MLISLLTPPNLQTDIDPDVFSPASDALQEIMTRSSLAGGAGAMSLTLPLLVWVDIWGPRIFQSRALLVLADAIRDILNFTLQPGNPLNFLTLFASSS